MIEIAKISKKPALGISEEERKKNLAKGKQEIRINKQTNRKALYCPEKTNKEEITKTLAPIRTDGHLRMTYPIRQACGAGRLPSGQGK